MELILPAPRPDLESAAGTPSAVEGGRVFRKALERKRVGDGIERTSRMRRTGDASLGLRGMSCVERTSLR